MDYATNRILVFLSFLICIIGLWYGVNNNFIYGGITIGVGVGLFFTVLILYNSKSGKGAYIEQDI